MNAAALRDGNRVSIPDADGGGTIIEFASPVSIQYERWFGSTQPVRGAPLSLITLPLVLEEKPDAVLVAGAFLNVTVSNTGAITIRTKSGRELAVMAKPAARSGFQLKALAGEQFYGLGAIDAPNLNLRGRIIPSTRPLLISNHGYGIFIPSGRATFDLAKSNPDAIAIETDHPTFQFYYGPNPKDILDQHAVATHRQIDISASNLNARDESRFPKEIEHVDINESNYCDSPRILNQLSLSGVLFPAIDLAKIGKYEQSIRLLPFLYDSKPPHPATRAPRATPGNTT